MHFSATAQTRAQRKGEREADAHREHHHPDPIVHGICSNFDLFALDELLGAGKRILIVKELLFRELIVISAGTFKFLAPNGFNGFFVLRYPNLRREGKTN